MGATDFSDIVWGADARDAFDKIVKEARYLYGHGGYTGTIAEKNGFIMITKEALPIKEAFQMVRDMEGEDERYEDKWGPACCIEIRPEPDNPKVKSGLREFLFFGIASS